MDIARDSDIVERAKSKVPLQKKQMDCLLVKMYSKKLSKVSRNLYMYNYPTIQLQETDDMIMFQTIQKTIYIYIYYLQNS